MSAPWLIENKLRWVYTGATIVHRGTDSEFQVCEKDGSGWWLKRLFDGTSERYSRADLLLFFEPVPPKTRFERIDDQ